VLCAACSPSQVQGQSSSVGFFCQSYVDEIVERCGSQQIQYLGQNCTTVEQALSDFLFRNAILFFNFVIDGSNTNCIDPLGSGAGGLPSSTDETRAPGTGAGSSLAGGLLGAISMMFMVTPCNKNLSTSRSDRIFLYIHI
jgi:hypothetical protein